VSAGATTPWVGFSQEGIDQIQAQGGDPADVSLGVGPSYLGEAVNATVAWWRIGAGSKAEMTTTLGDFFSTSADDRRTDRMSDPRLFYDANSGRWFFVAFDVTRTETELGISSSADPTRPWWIYSFGAAGCPDQPRIAVSDTMVGVSYNLFASCATRTPPYVGGVVWLFDKSAMLIGAAPASKIYGPDTRFIAITPAQSYDGGAPIYMVSTDYPSSQVILYTASNVGQSIPLRRIFVRLLRKSPPPYQLGSSVPLDPGDNRVQDAFVAGGNVWLAANDGCTVQASTSLQGCLRYVELSQSGLVLDQREEALANGRSALYPAFRPDGNGNLFSIYGYSSVGDYPGLASTIDPGHATGYIELKAGEAANESGRWGDYFSAARDPADTNRIWVAGAYGKSGSWGTFIAALAASPFAIPNPTPPVSQDLSPPYVVALPSSGRANSVIHLRYRLSDDSGRSRERIRVRRGGQVIATVRTALARITNGDIYYSTWRAPTGASATLSFCVVAWDPSGNQSTPSCAGLHIIGGH
jgi:hypothetical protein